MKIFCDVEMIVFFYRKLEANFKSSRNFKEDLKDLPPEGPAFPPDMHLVAKEGTSFKSRFISSSFIFIFRSFQNNEEKRETKKKGKEAHYCHQVVAPT